MRRVTAAAATMVGCLSLLAGGLTWAPAAAGSPPSSLSPSGPVPSSTPTLRWTSASPPGTRFVVEADDDPGFGSPAFSVTTANRAYTPTSNLPSGNVHWRVRESASGATWSSPALIEVTAVAPPTDLVPDGSVLANPYEPPLLSWSAVSGATGYEVQLDTTDDWIDATTYRTSGARLQVPRAQEPDRPWFWRVRAQRGAGLFTQWSSTASYALQPLARVAARQPIDDNTPDVPEAPGIEVTDVFLEWDPVPGAVKYELQVGLDRDFTIPVETKVLVGTRYSPARTYDNDQFFWRVRPIDSSGHKIAWQPGDTQEFQRIWPDAPTPLHPADTSSPAISGPLFLQWTPVAHASVYQVDIGTDANFSPGSFDSCKTHLTTLVLGTKVMQGQCDSPAGQGQTSYWRVRGIDDPTGVEGLYSPVQRFTYARPAVSQLLPENGTTVTTPTLSWEALPDVASYFVEIRRSDNSVAASVTTRALSWTPGTRLLRSGTTSETFTWTVQAIDTDSKRSPLRPGRSFTLTTEVLAASQDAALTPASIPAGHRAPQLTWSAWPGAHSYRVWVRLEDSEFWLAQATTPLTNTRWQYPAATDTSTYFHSPGTYVWFVQALAQSGAVLGEGPTSVFEIAPVPEAEGHAAALDGLSASRPAQACTKTLGAVVEDDAICTGLPSTPVLRWDPVPDAAYYLVYLANDREMTNRVLLPQMTPTHMWVPPAALPDNQAGQSYYWFVRPCRSDGACGPDPVSVLQAAEHAFRKTSPPIVLSSSTQGADQCLAREGGVSQDCLAFSWQDYRETNAGAFFDPRQAESRPSDIASPQSAQAYRIEVSTSRSFAPLVDSATVDQAGYTPSDKTYPEGELFWRVQAIDAAGTPLQWSETASLIKSSGAVEGLLPPDGAATSGLPTFSWDPQVYAATYRVEVYRGTDGTFSPADRVFSVSTPHRSFVWEKYLPPSDLPYTWRVQWIDASGREGAWTTGSTIVVRPGAVALVGPAEDAFEPGDRIQLAWQPVELAADYRVEIESGSRRVSDIVTVATAWHPLTTLGDGTYRWRVTARDPQSNALASSGWRTFRVDAVRPTVVQHAPARRLKRSGGVVRVSFSEPVTGVDARAFRLLPTQSRKALPVRVTLSETGMEATLTPARGLKKGTSYTVVLDSRPVDAAGNRLVPHSWIVKAR